MLVGNKCDLRQDGVNSVPTSYGEKLAMVMLMLMLIPFWFTLGFIHLESNPLMPYFMCVSPRQTYNTLFCETSAKDGSNTLEAVLHLAR